MATRLTPLYRRWIEGARFCVLSTVGLFLADMTDGEDGGAEYDATYAERAKGRMW